MTWWHDLMGCHAITGFAAHEDAVLERGVSDGGHGSFSNSGRGALSALFAANLPVVPASTAHLMDMNAQENGKESARELQCVPS
jgi:hypothetical protein